MEYFVNILYSSVEDSFTDVNVELYMKYLSEYDINKINSFYRTSDKKASLIGRLLLIRGLELYGVDISLVKTLKLGKYGKPYIPCLNMDFNISHSNKYVICALSLSGRVGVDIEYMKNVNVDMFNTILTNRELLSVNSAVDSIDALYDIWVTKEAFLKAIGVGLISDINFIESRFIKTNKYRGYKYFDIGIEDANYKAALVTTSDFPTINIKRINF